MSSNLSAEDKKCIDMEGAKRIGKDSIEYAKCLGKKLKSSATNEDSKFKLNTDSKLTEIIKGKEKIKIPNPITGLKNIGKALKPSTLEK